MAAITIQQWRRLVNDYEEKGRCGMFAVWKLCDPHLSASEVSFLLWRAIQMSVFTFYTHFWWHTRKS